MVLVSDRQGVRGSLHIYTLHGVGLKNEYLNFIVSDFVKKPGKSLHISVKRRFIIEY